MWFGEKVLLLFSRDPQTVKSHLSESALDPDPLQSFAANFPEFLRLLQGKNVLDFGCGAGRLTKALADAGASRVVGLDINQRWLRVARERYTNHSSDGKLVFVDHLDPDNIGSFDIVVSHDSVEHFTEPENCLQAIRSCCRPDGLIFVTFGPPWYSPYGSHMKYFITLPWVNLLFSEKTIMKVRARYRSDNAHRYEEVESGLNRMSITRFERLIAASGLTVLESEYHCIKGWQWLRHLPGLRELFINEVACVLKPSVPEPAATSRPH
jgi:SAM-dependent methyltransferase